MIAYFSHGYLCRRRHKLALIAESNLKFDSRFLRRKESSAEWRLVCKITDSKYKKKILYTTTIKKMIKKSENLLTIHTHPDSFPPSIDDINSNYDHNYEIGIVICHDGRVYMYSAEERINVNYYKYRVKFLSVE